MDRFYGKVEEHVFHLSGLNVVSLDLGQRRTDVPGAKGSLIIGEVEERYLGVFIALKGIISHAYNDRLKRLGALSSTWLASLPPQEVFNGLKFPLNSFLPLLERLDLPSQGFEVITWLREAGLAEEDSQKNRAGEYP